MFFIPNNSCSQNFLTNNNKHIGIMRNFLDTLYNRGVSSSETQQAYLFAMETP